VLDGGEGRKEGGKGWAVWECLLKIVIRIRRSVLTILSAWVFFLCECGCVSELVGNVEVSSVDCGDCLFEVAQWNVPFRFVGDVKS
jgi:hypothetical protein